MKQTKTKTKGNKLRDWYESLDLYGWWEKFSGEYRENGQHRYVTVHSFIKTRTKDKEKQALLWWILGPKSDEPRKPEYKEYPQFDWEFKRDKEPWCSSPKIEQIKANAISRASSMDEIKATGEFNLDDMARIKVLADQLDSEFGGRLQLPNLTQRENKIRLNNYLNLRNQLQTMLHNAQMMFAKTRSVDMMQLAEMLTVVGPSMLGQISGTQTLDAATQNKLKIFEEANLMMLKKATDWGLPLPDKDLEKAITPKTITIDRKKIQ